MALTIKHAKTNTITDWTQAQLDAIIAGAAAPLPPIGTLLANVTLPSDWNAALTYTGFLEASAVGAAGSNTQIQYNNNGVLGGIATYTFDPVSGALTNSTNGAASLAAHTFTGTPFAGTGTSSVPLLYFNNAVTQPTTWSTARNYIGINAPAGFSGRVFDYHVNGGGSVFNISGPNGDLFMTGDIALSGGTQITYSASTILRNISNGVYRISNNAVSGFTRLVLGNNTAGGGVGIDTTATTAISFTLGDGTGNATVTTGQLNSNGNIQIRAADNYFWTGRSRVYSPADGIIELYNNTFNAFTRLVFGPTTTSGVAIDTSAGTSIAFTLGDGTGSANISAGNIITKLASVAAIDGKTIANTALYVVPAGKTAIITQYVVRCSAATAITIGASAGIGNIAGTNNISASQTMTALATTNDLFDWAIVGMSIITAATGTVYFNQGTAATGTSQTLVVDLYGYLV